MADLNEHCEHTLGLYGVEGRGLHQWIDGPVVFVGPAHRGFARHNKDVVNNLPRKFVDKYGFELAKNIVIDHLLLDGVGRKKKPKEPKKCKECEKFFKPRHHAQKFCSVECKVEYNKPKPRECQYCHKIFQPIKPEHKDQKFCSRGCYIGYVRERADKKGRERIEELQKTNICPECGKEFIRIGNRKKYCCTTCRIEATKKRRNDKRKHPCKLCGELTNRPKFCSDKCAFDFNRKPNKCEICGVEVSTTAKYCCKCYGIKMAETSKMQGNWNFTSRVFAKFICNLRDMNREAYLEVRDSLTDEQKIKFDKILAKYYQKFYGKTYR